MALYIMIGSFLVFCLILMAWSRFDSHSKPQDSVLKQRAILNLNEQLTFTRLKEVLPDSIILGHVSYDALLTTKFYRTRSKYRHLAADFVILDQHHQVQAIVAVDDPLILKRPQQAQYQDALLSMAGYRVIRYHDVPEYYQLRRDFLKEKETVEMHHQDVALKKYDLYSDLERQKAKVLNP